jgi:Tfp pilus assembly protein PilN
MIEINLLAAKYRPRVRSSHKRAPTLAPVPRAFPIALAGLTLLMGLLIAVSGTRVGASQRKSERLQQELAEAKAQAARAEHVVEDFPALSERYLVLASRLDGRIGWLDILRAICMRCPEGALITSLKVELDRRTGQPSKLVIRGLYSEGTSLEMSMASGLQESASFSKVFDAVIPEKTILPDGRTSFAISCPFRPFQDELTSAPDEASAR